MKARPILIVEDEHALGSALGLLVRRMGHLPTLVASGQAGLKALGSTAVDAVVLDIGLPDMSGLEVLEQLRRTHAELPVLVITAHATLQHAIDSQKSGATAYLTKPLDMRQFQQTLDSLLAPQVEINDTAVVEAAIPDSPTLIGGAPCLQSTFIGIAKACAGDFPVLITGPGGSGKSLTASVIHAHGRQSGDPLQVIDCSRFDGPSSYEDLSVGSLVLDEITSLAGDAQAALAAWLSASDRVGARVMATTSRDPLAAVREGGLREDLYYALSPLTVPLPSLAERSGDILALCAFFAGMKSGGKMPVITPPVMAAMQAYAWPGNVRELRYVVDYALSMSRGGAVFLSHLPKHVADACGDAPAELVTGGELESVIQRWIDQELSQPEELLPVYDELVQKIESLMLKYLLEKHENKPTRLAQAMNLHRGTLRQKLQRMGLQRKED